MSENYPEYEENYDAAGAYDAAANYDASEMDPASLASVIEQSSALGAQRAMTEVMNQQQQSQQFAAMQQIAAVSAEAERGLESWDKNWPARREVAARVIQEHPTFIGADALADPERMAEGLWKAASWGEAEAENQRQRLKVADDAAFADRIVRAHRKSYSAYRQATDAGESVHDILDNS